MTNEEMADRKRIGARLKQMRMARGMSQSDVADKVRILRHTRFDRAHVSRAERAAHLLTIETIALLCTAMGANLLEAFAEASP